MKIKTTGSETYYSRRVHQKRRRKRKTTDSNTCLLEKKPEVAPENKTAKAAKLREQVLQFKKAAQRKVRVVQFIYLLIQLLI